MFAVRLIIRRTVPRWRRRRVGRWPERSGARRCGGMAWRNIQPMGRTCWRRVFRWLRERITWGFIPSLRVFV